MLLAFDPVTQPPSPGQWGALLAALALDGAGYYALTLAMRMGDVSVITPFRYARILFAIAIGMAVFAERPDAWTIAGSVVIIGSGLYTFMREHMRRSAAKAL